MVAANDKTMAKTPSVAIKPTATSLVAFIMGANMRFTTGVSLSINAATKMNVQSPAKNRNTIPTIMATTAKIGHRIPSIANSISKSMKAVSDIYKHLTILV